MQIKVILFDETKYLPNTSFDMSFEIQTIYV